MNKNFLLVLGAVFLLAESCFAAASTWQVKIDGAKTSAAAEELVSQIQGTMRGKSGAKLAQLQQDLSDARQRVSELRQYELMPAAVGGHVAPVVPGRGHVSAAQKIRHNSSDAEIEARAIDRVRKGRGGGLKRGGRGARTGDPEKDLASERVRLFNKRQQLAIKERRAGKGRKAATGGVTKEVKAHRGYNQQQVEAALEALLDVPANAPGVAMAKCIAAVNKALDDAKAIIEAIAATAGDADAVIMARVAGALAAATGVEKAALIAANANAADALGLGDTAAGVAKCAAIGAALYGLSQSLPADGTGFVGVGAMGAQVLSNIIAAAAGGGAAVGSLDAVVATITQPHATAVATAPGMGAVLAAQARHGAVAAAAVAPFPATAPGLVAAVAAAVPGAKNEAILKAITAPMAGVVADGFALATDAFIVDVNTAIRAADPKHAALVACTKDDLHNMAAAQLYYWVEAEMAAATPRYHSAGELAAKYKSFVQSMKAAQAGAGSGKIKEIRKAATGADLAKIAARKAGRHQLKNKAERKKLQHTIQKGLNLAQQAAAAREALDGNDNQDIAAGVNAVKQPLDAACLAAGLAPGATMAADAMAVLDQINAIRAQVGIAVMIPGMNISTAVQQVLAAAAPVAGAAPNAAQLGLIGAGADIDVATQAARQALTAARAFAGLNAGAGASLQANITSFGAGVRDQAHRIQAGQDNLETAIDHAIAAAGAAAGATLAEKIAALAAAPAAPAAGGLPAGGGGDAAAVRAIRAVPDAGGAADLAVDVSIAIRAAMVTARLVALGIEAMAAPVGGGAGVVAVAPGIQITANLAAPSGGAFRAPANITAAACGAIVKLGIPHVRDIVIAAHPDIVAIAEGADRAAMVAAVQGNLATLAAAATPDDAIGCDIPRLNGAVVPATQSAAAVRRKIENNIVKFLSQA